MFEPIQATWNFTREELEAHWGVLFRCAGGHRKQGTHGSIILCAVLGLCSIAAALAPSAGFFVGFMCFVVVMVFWTLVYHLSRLGDARVARHWAGVLMAEGPQTVEITQTYLRFLGANCGVDSTIKWSRVADVSSAGASLTIWLNDFQALLLPKRVFHPSEVDRILGLWSSVKLACNEGDVPEWLVREGPSSLT